MTRERKILLFLLISTFSSFITFLGFRQFQENLEGLEEKINLLHQQLDRLNVQKSVPSHPLPDEKSLAQIHRFYESQSNPKELYLLGQSIKELCIALNIQVEQYQELQQQNDQALLFYLIGSPQDLFHFLNSHLISTVEVSSFSLDSQHLPARVQLRIAPVELPDSFQDSWKDYFETADFPEEALKENRNRRYSPYQLASLFPPPHVESKIPQPEEPKLVERADPAPEIDRRSILFIGRVTGADKDDRYYFKDTRNGQIFQISPGQSESSQNWIMKEESDNAFILEYKNQKYEVNR